MYFIKLGTKPQYSSALISEAASITDGERGRKVAMGVGLCTQSVGLGLKDPYRVYPGREPHRGRIALGQRHERSGKLRRVAALLAVHARPGGHSLFRALGIVVNRRRGIGG